MKRELAQFMRFSGSKTHVLLVAAILLLQGPALQLEPVRAAGDPQDLWVDARQTNCAPRDGKTPEEAFCTISEAAADARAGTTVHIMAGTYREHVVPSYSGSMEEGYIVYMAEPGEEVVLDGTGINFSDWLGLFDLRDKSYIQVSGLHVQNSDWAGIFVERSDHIVVSDNTTYNTRSSGIYVRDSSYVSVLRNDVRKAVNGGTQECISIASVSHFEVAHNTVHDGVGLYLGGEGIDVKESSSYGAVHHNQVHDLPHDYDPKVHEDGEVGIYIDAYSGYLHTVEVYQNQVSAPVGIAIGAEQGGLVENVQVFNNLVHDGYSQGVIVTDWVQPDTGTKKGIRIINNTVVRNGRGIDVQSPLVEDIVVRNNIASDNDDFQLRVIGEARSETVADHNLIGGFRGYPDETVGEAAVEGDPEFEAPSLLDFHLTPTSPAIDRGNAAEAPTTDFDGSQRPIDGDMDGFPAMDLGAFEYAPSPTFADVPFDHPFHDVIEILYQNGYTAGCSTDPLMYCPDNAMNRGESAVFVVHGIRGADVFPPQPTSQTFADLPLDSWAAKWAEALWQDGYTAGCGTDPLVYCPWQGHSRAEGCVFFLHMLNGATYEPPQPTQQTFADVPLEAWYAKWVAAAYDAGLIPACGEAPFRFCPEDPLTRGLAAYVMVQAKDLQNP